MDKKVSVVVTCYNHEKYIEECLRSIFGQTHQEIELLIFNDGSTDASGDVISEVLQDSPFTETHYFSEKNRGLAYVRNDALSKMTGDFLLFVDSDNFLNDDHIEKLLTELSATNSDIAYCQLWDFNAQRDVLRPDLEYSFEKQIVGNLIDASSLVRSSKIIDAKFDESLNNQTLEDYDFWLNLIINNEAKPVYVSTTKLNYRVLNESLSKRGNWENYYKSYFYIINKYIQKIPAELIEALQKNLLLWVDNYQNLVIDSEQKLADKEQELINHNTQEEIMRKIIADKDTHIANQEKVISDITSSLAYRILNKLLHPLGKKHEQ
ncbi:glycosyltransferase family 2 protein [Lactococcus lactis]|uniref:glycosyltransferase family 2 protein n=1 Tax=Lactococcus lactis TaxID=1358 RepID=UPI0025A0A9F0|nr:glycosyltransferase family 2 protein [Lactococcus lactis]MDM7513204.1 glycosyltransferase family 2 protein [Lactococcus lactis]